VLEVMGTNPRRAATAALGVAAVVGVAVWFLRPPAPPVETTLPFASSTAATSPTTTEPTVMLVHVAGAVRAPGVIELQSGSRVVDAIDAAGGAVSEADLARLNLASPVTDGQQVYVPRAGEVVPVDAPSPAGVDPASSRVNLNTASADDLDALPGIGPATAQAILDWRVENGAFTTVDDLLEVRGIGEAKLADLRDLVTV
jgi:competence protein ComEA